MDKVDIIKYDSVVVSTPSDNFYPFYDINGDDSIRRIRLIQPFRTFIVKNKKKPWLLDLRNHNSS
jgi:hypothetical protein